MLYLSSGSPQNIYQYIQDYVVIGLMNIYWSNQGENLINNIICIIFWRNTFMISIRENIIPNLPFQSSSQLLDILSVPRNIYFDDTRKTLLIGPHFMYYENINECVLKIEMEKPLEANEQIVGN